jgi:hypothetical protein
MALLAGKSAGKTGISTTPYPRPPKGSKLSSKNDRLCLKIQKVSWRRIVSLWKTSFIAGNFLLCLEIVV